LAGFLLSALPAHSLFIPLMPAHFNAQTFSYRIGRFRKELEMATKPIVEQRGLRAQAAAKYCGLGRSTFLRYVAQKTAPQPRKLSPGAVIWLRDDLDNWMEAQQ
jgi:predicted DNA-binding transcriptional regulator AlpA